MKLSSLEPKTFNMSASSVNIGQIVGCLLGGYCGGRFGPKRTILASCVPAALGWIIIASSPHLSTLILGRILSGIAGGFSSSNCSLLVAQYRFLVTRINQFKSWLKYFSSVKLRGGFLSLYALNLSLGILTTYCLGALLYWRIVSIIPTFINFILFLALWRIPESPLWLLSHRGTEDCREVLQWLR